MTGGCTFSRTALVRGPQQTKNQMKASSSDRYFQHKHVKNIFEKQLKNKYLVLNNITSLVLPFSRFVQYGFQFQKATINVHNSLEHLRSIRHHSISNPNPPYINSNHIHLDFYIPYVLIYPFGSLLFFPHLLTRGSVEVVETEIRHLGKLLTSR